MEYLEPSLFAAIEDELNRLIRALSIEELRRNGRIIKPLARIKGRINYLKAQLRLRKIKASPPGSQP